MNISDDEIKKAVADAHVECGSLKGTSTHYSLFFKTVLKNVYGYVATTKYDEDYSLSILHPFVAVYENCCDTIVDGYTILNMQQLYPRLIIKSGISYNEYPDIITILDRSINILSKLRYGDLLIEPMKMFINLFYSATYQLTITDMSKKDVVFELYKNIMKNMMTLVIQSGYYIHYVDTDMLIIEHTAANDLIFSTLAKSMGRRLGNLDVQLVKKEEKVVFLAKKKYLTVETSTGVSTYAPKLRHLELDRIKGNLNAAWINIYNNEIIFKD